MSVIDQLLNMIRRPRTRTADVPSDASDPKNISLADTIAFSPDFKRLLYTEMGVLKVYPLDSSQGVNVAIVNGQPKAYLMLEIPNPGEEGDGPQTGEEGDIILSANGVTAETGQRALIPVPINPKLTRLASKNSAFTFYYDKPNDFFAIVGASNIDFAIKGEPVDHTVILYKMQSKQLNFRFSGNELLISFLDDVLNPIP